MKVTIKYVCPECEAPGQVSFTDKDDRKDFACLNCGFENSIEIKAIE